MEAGVKDSSKKKLARSRWAGYVDKMRDKNLAKRADTQKVEGKGRRGRRPKLRWDCIKSDLERVREE